MTTSITCILSNTLWDYKARAGVRVDTNIVEQYINEDRVLQTCKLINNKQVNRHVGGFIRVYEEVSPTVLNATSCVTLLLFDTANDKQIFYRRVMKDKLSS